MFFDSGFLLFVLPALLFAMYAQSQVKTTFEKYSRYQSQRGYTGAQVAKQLLMTQGINDVKIEYTQGRLGDHYDPRSKTLRLSPQVYGSTSVAAIGVAAHEVGHAIQHNRGYVPLALRNGIVPLAQFGSNAAMPLFFIGLIFRLESMMNFGILFFILAVMFQIITLPVEFNASSRAIALLTDNNLIGSGEGGAVKKVLNAAALTYVAATAMAIAQLLRLLMLRNSRR